MRLFSSFYYITTCSEPRRRIIDKKGGLLVRKEGKIAKGIEIISRCNLQCS